MIRRSHIGKLSDFVYVNLNLKNRLKNRTISYLCILKNDVIIGKKENKTKYRTHSSSSFRFFLLCKNPHPGKMVPPCANPAPKGAGARAMPHHYLYGTLPTKNVFTKQRLRPPRGALRGGGNHLKGGMGASAPIITSNDFYRANFLL